jgi:hypothetical protein
MIEEQREHKYRAQNGETPAYKAYHEVRVTKNLGELKKDEIVSFIDKNIVGFKGHVEDKHGIPIMLFDRKQDAQAFVDELSSKLKIQREHITIKAQKFTR